MYLLHYLSVYFPDVTCVIQDSIYTKGQLTWATDIKVGPPVFKFHDFSSIHQQSWLTLLDVNISLYPCQWDVLNN